jgi:hypothetical protein
VRHLIDAATKRLRQQLTLLSHSVPMQRCDSAISIELFLLFYCWLAFAQSYG